ncbi:uncharacterized protein LOC125725295 isoform X7 [Brienomyrus brachyistius]|uniref:uncharacterized protein LOC125725295 isoform X7 n=1 Tax=Brienomyrus brachyistius TaxID=42636 RepID=UPI0020B24156|nr:uncharacterized protein LOC125725295 isoform X7 [Brienomyrus brachyistius]
MYLFYAIPASVYDLFIPRIYPKTGEPTGPGEFPNCSERKMTRLLVLVLACGVLLISTEAQQDYHSLPALYKTAIKLAVEKAHQGTSQHMNFYNIQGRPKISNDYIDIEILLRATNCAKSAEPDHRDDCVFMTNRPFINCRVCSRRSGNDLTHPSIDCVPNRKVNQDKRRNMCPSDKPLLGSKTALASKDTKEAEGDCLGCF